LMRVLQGLRYFARNPQTRVDLIAVEDRRDAGMSQARHRFNLTRESFARTGEVPLLGTNQLECDDSTEGGLFGFVYDSHAAGPHA
jgi:hypothetical protein